MVTKVSAAIITYNEEQNIARCIESLSGIADEIVVVDSGSQDQTQEIARSLGALVVENPFKGHIQQKNFAVSQCQYNWILSLDADEALSHELKGQIKTALKSPLADAYQFNRLTNYCGFWIKHCGWYPDTKIRLFKKDAGAWGGRNPHDKWIPDSGAKVQWLKGDILHYTFYTVEEHKAQIESFTTIAAEAMFQEGKGSNKFKAVGKGVFKFIRNYILKRGFLDGRIGFQICWLSGKATYLRYYKLMLLQKNG